MHMVPEQMEQAGMGMAQAEGLSCEPLCQVPGGEDCWKHSQLLPWQSALVRGVASVAQKNESTSLNLPA